MQKVEVKLLIELNQYKMPYWQLSSSIHFIKCKILSRQNKNKFPSHFGNLNLNLLYTLDLWLA